MKKNKVNQFEDFETGLEGMEQLCVFTGQHKNIDIQEQFFLWAKYDIAQDVNHYKLFCEDKELIATFNLPLKFGLHNLAYLICLYFVTSHTGDMQPQLSIYDKEVIELIQSFPSKFQG